MTELEWKKQTSKSIFYEIGDYQNKIPISNEYVFIREQHKSHLEVIDENKSMITCYTITIKNMKSEKNQPNIVFKTGKKYWLTWRTIITAKERLSAGFEISSYSSYGRFELTPHIDNHFQGPARPSPPDSRVFLRPASIFQISPYL